MNERKTLGPLKSKGHEAAVIRHEKETSFVESIFGGGREFPNHFIVVIDEHESSRTDFFREALTRLEAARLDVELTHSIRDHFDPSVLLHEIVELSSKCPNSFVHLPLVGRIEPHLE